MIEFILDPVLWTCVFCAGSFAFIYYYCSRIAIRIPPEEVPELPIEEFSRVRNYYRYFLLAVTLFFIIFEYLVWFAEYSAETYNFSYQKGFDRILIACSCVLFVFSLVLRFRAGRIQKAHGLSFFHFDGLIWKRAMKGIQ